MTAQSRSAARTAAALCACAAALGAAGCAGLSNPARGDAAAAAAPAATAGATAAAPAAGAASAPPAAAAAASAPGARPPGAAAATPTSPLPPFATVIKDARRIAGPVPMWQREDKLWIEVTPALLNKPFLLSPKIRSGIGQGMIFGGLMAYPINGAGGPQVVEFVRSNSLVQVIARNLEVTAAAGTPQARAVESAFSASLLGSATVASLPQPDTQAVLIEAGNLFIGDLMGLGMQLQRVFRQGYGLDRTNSTITAVRAGEQASIVEVRQHFYTASVAVPQPGGMPGTPAPSTPNYLPDARSLFVGVSYSLAPLPEVPMTPRRADPRIGLFSNTVLDFSNDLARTPRQRWIDRWRLDKRDPAAEMSEPVRPIVFWIDRNVPVEYRDAVRDGILEWNKAFERIGFRNAIEVRQQPDDADWDTLDFGRASVRWMADADPTFGAIGPRHVDPRTGEILDADIGLESLSARSIRAVRRQFLGAGAAAPATGVETGDPAFSAQACTIADVMQEQLGYALDVLQARGELDADGEDVRRFVHDYIQSTVIHEVGHTLGLRHNFRASRAYTDEQLADVAFTREHGVAGSVMEYPAINLPRPGHSGGLPFQTTLGPYDYWAIEYAYRPLAPADEASALQRIASRNTEPWLAFGTDEDAFLGVDPETLQLDLGRDPLAFAAGRIEIARDLFRRQESRRLSPDDDWSVLRRSLNYAIADVARAVAVLTRQIGGVRTLRDFPGSGRDPLEPLDAATQRRALDLIAQNLLAADGLQVSPQLQRRLAPDYLDRSDLAEFVPTDYSVPQRLLDIQRAVLNQLMSDALAARLLDSEGKVLAGDRAFTLAELVERLDRDVWSELAPRRPVVIAAARRDLQREYLNRVAAVLLRPSAATRADARALMRRQARLLLPRLEAAASHAADPTTRAHLEDCVDTLRGALTAATLRAGA